MGFFRRWSNPARPSSPAASAIARAPRLETLESRQLLSSESTSLLLDYSAAAGGANTSGAVLSTASLTKTATATLTLAASTTAAVAPTLPNVRRNYLGDAFDQKNTKLALVIKIRKQENRDGYASLRGDIRLGTPEPVQIYFTSITYGKLRPNLHVDFKFSGSLISGSISGKVSASGSQIKGTYSVTGSIKSSGTFKVNKVTGIG
jgi:hypothetical protein